MTRIRFISAIATLIATIAMGIASEVRACTGISLKAKDGTKVIARTMEWGTFVLPSNLIIVPRGYTQLAETPTGKNGLRMVAKYGYAGIGVLESNFVAEAMNERGLVVELFYFPGYGECEEYDPANNATTITDAQFLSWVVGSFATVDELVKELPNIHMVAYGKGFESAHFNIADASGRHIVLEYYDGRFHVHENPVGVITNSPSFDWHMTNLNNYINMYPGMAPPYEMTPGVNLRSIGQGSAALGLPGDVTPPSRFIRAAFYIHTAAQQPTGKRTVMQAFQILNNFDIPIGAEFANKKDIPADMLSASQWITACDTKALRFYYRTEWNYMIRCIDLREIDFANVKYQALPLDNVKEPPVEHIRIQAKC